MRSVTFVLDTQTGSDGMAPVTVTIVEQADGSLLFTLSNDADGDGQIADLRGLFLDVADDSLLGTLSFIGADITQIVQSGDVTNLGGGVTTSGIPDAPYEIGLEFGTAGMSADDIQSTSFVLSSSARALTIDDFALGHIAVRQTSVGAADGAREDSDKLYGETPYPVNAQDDYVAAAEDEVHTGNVFANDIDLDAGDMDGDGIADGLTVVAVDGAAGNVGLAVEVAPGIFIAVAADGSYVLDTENADWLAEGESFDGSISYTVDDGNGGSDSAVLAFSVAGVNDTPDAVDDAAATNEASVVTGSVLANDSDPDLSDTLAVYSVNGDTLAVGQTIELASGALLTLNSDGSYSYDPNGAFDDLNTGEYATDGFSYQVSDGHGGFDDAYVEITVEGMGGDAGRDVDAGDHFGTFANKKGLADHDISNVVLYLQDDEGGILKVKIDGWSGEKDLDDVDLDVFLNDNDLTDYDLLAVSIKAGNNHNRDLGPGEGQLFLLDGDDDIDYLAGGQAPEGLTLGILGAKADMTFTYSADMFI